MYLDERELPAGDVVRAAGGELRLRWTAAVAFVDLEPTLNWEHRCRYLVVRLDGQEIEAVEARFPPFLKGRAPTLRVVWTGARVPAWLKSGFLTMP